MKRERVAAEWRRDPYRTAGAVADAADCEARLARAVRDELLAAGGLPADTPRDGRVLDAVARREAARARVRAAILADPAASNAAIEARLGCGHGRVAAVRAELQAEGLLP